LATNATKKAASRKADASKVKRKRRTKGPSEKIRTLAAISLAAKVGYLKLTDLIGIGNPALEAQITEKLQRRNYKPGDQVYPAKAKESVLYFVQTGSVRIYRIASTGARFDVKSLGPGSIFGEFPQLGQTMLGSQAEAAEPSRILSITGSDFEKIAATAPQIPLALIKHLGTRLVEAERRHEQAAFQPVTARTASLLTRLSDDHHQVVGFTHQEMADLLGVYRETITNAIAELKQDKLIKVGRKRITLLEPDTLRKMETI